VRNHPAGFFAKFGASPEGLPVVPDAGFMQRKNSSK